MKSSKKIKAGAIEDYISPSAILALSDKLTKGGYTGSGEDLRLMIVAASTGATGTSIIPENMPTGTGVNSWIAVQAGTYTNFGNVVVTANSFAVISRNVSGVFSISQTALDLSSYAEKEVGINKINPALIPANGSGWIGTNGVANDNGVAGMRNSGFQSVGANKPYLLSGCGTGTGFSICLYDINKTYISTVPTTAFNTVMPLSFSTTATTAFVRFTTQFNSGVDSTPNIMLEQTSNTIPNPYTAYSVTIPKSLIPRIEYPNVYETQIFNPANVINNKFIGLYNEQVAAYTGAILYRFEVDAKLKYFIDLPDNLNLGSDGYRGFVVFNSLGVAVGNFNILYNNVWESSNANLKTRIHKHGYKIDKLPIDASYILFNLQVINVNNWESKAISIKAVDYVKKQLSYSYGQRYLSLGDSITHRDSDSAIPTIGYQNEINDALNTSNYVNKGVSSMYMKGSGGTLTTSLYVLGTSLNYINYDLVSILIGTNDFGFINTPIGTTDSIDLATFYGSYNKLLEYIFASNPKTRVVIMTPPQRFDISQSTPNGVGHTLKDYATATLNVASKWGLEYLDLYNQGVWNFRNIAVCSDDNLHGNDFGNKILGKRLLGIL